MAHSVKVLNNAGFSCPLYCQIARLLPAKTRFYCTSLNVRLFQLGFDHNLPEGSRPYDFTIVVLLPWRSKCFTLEESCSEFNLRWIRCLVVTKHYWKVASTLLAGPFVEKCCTDCDFFQMPKQYPYDFYRAFPFDDPRKYPITNYSFDLAEWGRM